MPDAGKNRREFLKAAAAAGAAGLWVVLIPKPGAAQRVHVIEEAKAKGLPEWLNHYYVYVIDTAKCIGCGGCVRACERENNVPAGYHRTWVERYQVNDEGHVFVESPKGGMEGFPLHHEAPGKVTKGFFVPKMCNHCRNTPCTQVCPVHASYETPDGVVLVDKKVCIGCGYCVQACPYGSRYLDPRDHTADKCTWCYHRITKGLLPACVTVCPTKTRVFGDMKDENSLAREIVETLRVTTLKPELNTEPFCFYLGLDRAVR
ncbi:MAG: 4Fe-4S dicluster domain-containing protein [Nitrospinae bacterium]|nr:4Fe-4S dicluster domain-containing protein [Nitrospinota bacterium]